MGPFLFCENAMVRRPCLSLLLLLAFLGPLELLAQQQVGGIGGQVRIAGGDFVQHQVVVELRFRGATINSTYADSQGRLAFGELEPDPTSSSTTTLTTRLMNL